jgi:hypothetical protein
MLMYTLLPIVLRVRRVDLLLINTVSRDALAPFGGAGWCRMGSMCLHWIETSRPCPPFFTFLIHSSALLPIFDMGSDPRQEFVCAHSIFALLNFVHVTLH